MRPIDWDDQVQVQIIEMQERRPGEKIKSARILWDGISLAEAVSRWQRLPQEDQPLVTIFGQETFAGSEIEELAKRGGFHARP